MSPNSTTPEMRRRRSMPPSMRPEDVRVPESPMLGCGEDGSALRSIEDIGRPGSGETQVAGRELIGQEIQVLPNGEARSLQPGDGLSQVPALFTPQQVQRLEEMQSKAPFLHQQRPLPALPASTIRATAKPERTKRKDAIATALKVYNSCSGRWRRLAYRWYR